LFFHIPTNLHPVISQAWQRAGQQPLDKFAPYAAYVLTIEIFFQIALAANLIGSGRASNRTDIAYLFYLPFSTVFISSDNLHRKCAPLFLRTDQEFVWGIDLKGSLRAINAHFLELPEATRERGVMNFANVPPDGNLVADLWDRHLRGGFRKEPPVTLTSEESAKLLKRFKEHLQQPPTDPTIAGNSEEEMMSIKRMVRRRRGSWWQVPKDLPDSTEE
jgi:hypothetical protein